MGLLAINSGFIVELSSLTYCHDEFLYTETTLRCTFHDNIVYINIVYRGKRKGNIAIEKRRHEATVIVYIASNFSLQTVARTRTASTMASARATPVARLSVSVPTTVTRW